MHCKDHTVSSYKIAARA